MKRLHINFIGVTPVTTFIAPGIWKYLTSASVVWLVVKNDTPNQNMEDWGGYNLVNFDADTDDFPSGISVSIKQYTTFAAEFALAVPKGCLANYRTLAEAIAAAEAGTNTQGLMLFDNV